MILFSSLSEIFGDEIKGYHLYSLSSEIACNQDANSKVAELPNDDGYVLMVACKKSDADAVLADIQTRIDNGQTPVLKSHLEALGLDEAVERWARES